MWGGKGWGSSLQEETLHIYTLRVRLVHSMKITTGIVIFITMNKMCCNGITKSIH